jgi:SAM-dependent methyltransferase
MNIEDYMEFMHELFDSSIPRLGPGSDHSTKQALDVLFSANPKLKDIELRILDIGCGNGSQTLELAKHVDGSILAVDNHQPYLDELQRRAESEGVSGKIQTFLRDMCDMGLPGGSFDLIWSEGALYNMGFREGLETCHSLLVPGGFLAASELAWFRSDTPAECSQYFANEYPAMVDIDTNISLINNAGYKVVDHFNLPESAWWESFYNPLEVRIKALRKKYASDPQQLEMINSVDMEIDMYRKYSSYYGYAFFLMQQSN